MATNKINSMRFQLKRDSSTNWKAHNPTLLIGEVGWEIDTNKFKIGDGTKKWNELSYIDATYALKSEIPINNNQLTNGAGYITSAALNNYALKSSIPTNNNQLANGSGYITAAALNGYAQTSQIPTKTSQLSNDSGYITNSALSGYMPLSGGTFTGSVHNSFGAKLIGSKLEEEGDIPTLIDALSKGCGAMGSVQITTAYTKNNVTIPATWYNYIYIPHRWGSQEGDNSQYGTLILMEMTSFGGCNYIVHWSNGGVGGVSVFGSYGAVYDCGNANTSYV